MLYKKCLKLNLLIPNKSEKTTKTTTKTMNRKRRKIYFKHLELEEEPHGLGLTGQVYIAHHLDAVFAVKKIDVSRKSVSQTPENILNIFKSIYNPTPVSCSADHHNCPNENIVTLHKLFYKHGTVFAVLDYMDGGSLLDIVRALNQERFIISEKVLSSIVYQVLNGFVSLHKLFRAVKNNDCMSSEGSCNSGSDGVPLYAVSDSALDSLSSEDQEMIRSTTGIHKNVKTSNILLDSTGCVKLQDSGCRTLRNLFNINEHTMKATCDQTYFQNEFGYLAPETMRGSCTASSDIWSLGIVLLECLYGQFPISFAGNTVFTKIINFSTSIQNEGRVELLLENARCSSELKDFISQCLRTVPEERPSLESLINQEFIVKHNKSLIESHETVRYWMLQFIHPPCLKFGFRSGQKLFAPDIEIITTI
jgi:serine/threonine protein kinase